MKAIIAKNAAGFIGLNNRLPWQCKADLAHFKAMTAEQTLLVGFRTFIGLPVLKGRELRLDARGAELVDINGIDWCIGGKATYEKYSRFFTELHISTITDDYTIGDVDFPLLILSPNCKIIEYQFNKDFHKDNQ